MILKYFTINTHFVSLQELEKKYEYKLQIDSFILRVHHPESNCIFENSPDTFLLSSLDVYIVDWVTASCSQRV